MRLLLKIDNSKSSSFALTLTLNSNRLRFIFCLLLYIVSNIRILFEYYSNNIREYKYYLSNICEYKYRLEYSNIANITTEFGKQSLTMYLYVVVWKNLRLLCSLSILPRFLLLVIWFKRESQNYVDLASTDEDSVSSAT